MAGMLVQIECRKARDAALAKFATADGRVRAADAAEIVKAALMPLYADFDREIAELRAGIAAASSESWSMARARTVLGGPR